MRRSEVVGNRVMLAGAVLYLLEFVAIIPVGNGGPADPGTNRQAIVAMYQAHPRAVGFLAGWLSLVLLGRVVLMLGLRAALRAAGRPSLIIDMAVLAMAASVILEVATYAVVAAAAAVASGGGSADMVVGLDAAASLLNRMIFAPIGVAVGLGALAMWWSGVFPRWIAGVGGLSGVLLVVAGLLSSPGYLHPGVLRDVGGAGEGIGVLLFWLWMLAGGIFLFRRAPRRSPEPPVSSP